MASGVTLRRARAEDREAVRAVSYDTFASTWRPQLTAHAAQRFVDEDRPGAYFTARGLEFIVAEVGGVIIGFVDWDGDFVNALHVRADHARQGVGALLMDHAEAAIAAAGFATARLETDTFNTRSQAFYAKRGYVEAGRYPDEEWDSGLTTLLLVKPL